MERSPMRGRSRTGRIRIEDVAAHAGVSAMTVSRALRRPELLSEAMRARVLNAVQAVGYTPDLVAKSLASNRTGIISAVIPTLGNPLFAEMLDEIQKTIASLGYHLILGNSQYSAEGEEAIIAALLGRRPEGVILVGVAHTPGTRKLLSTAALPVVELWDLTDEPIDMLIGFSNEAAAYAMVTHLAGAGRRRIVHVTGRASDAARAAVRRRGYETAIRQLGTREAMDAGIRGSVELRTWGRGHSTTAKRRAAVRRHLLRGRHNGGGSHSGMPGAWHPSSRTDWDCRLRGY